MGDNSFFKGIFNKGKQEKVYTETDLVNADKEYVEAVTALNSVDFGAEDYDEQKVGLISNRYKEASKTYQTIHKALHPDMYTGENAGTTYLPEIPLTENAKTLDMGSMLADK